MLRMQSDQGAENAVYGGLGLLLITDYVSDDFIQSRPRFASNRESLKLFYLIHFPKRLDGSDALKCLRC